MSKSAEKPLSTPAAWKNTYFWIAGILVLVALVGLLTGQDSIRDPGQRDENGLVLIYLVAAVVMVVNGLMSHRHTVQLWEEAQDSK